MHTTLVAVDAEQQTTAASAFRADSAAAWMKQTRQAGNCGDTYMLPVVFESLRVPGQVSTLLCLSGQSSPLQKMPNSTEALAAAFCWGSGRRCWTLGRRSQTSDTIRYGSFVGRDSLDKQALELGFLAEDEMKGTMNNIDEERAPRGTSLRSLSPSLYDSKICTFTQWCKRASLCVVPLIVASPALQALVRAGIAGTGIAGSICGPGAAKDAESQPRAGEAQRRRREGDGLQPTSDILADVMFWLA